MSDQSNRKDGAAEGSFLSRWSQRKAAVRDASAPTPETPAKPPVSEAASVVDPRELPPVETLGEDSDYTVFLRQGVPDAMRKAALRKLWVTEPSVVNYRPLVEYAWHNNEPGFGPLLPTDNIEKLLRQVISGSEVEEEATPAEEDAVVTDPPVLEQTAEQPLSGAVDQPKREEAAAVIPPRRRHGGALPT